MPIAWSRVNFLSTLEKLFMNDAATEATTPESGPDINPEMAIGRALHFASYIFAMLGGLIMTALTVMTVVSVIGRWLFSAPIFGDFELVEIGTAVSVFLFLPYCHMNRGNVIVDLFLAWTSKTVQTLFDILGSIALSIIAGLLAWRMTIGGFDMFEYNETTYILALPVWGAFPFAVASLVLLALCSAYTAVHDGLRILR